MRVTDRHACALGAGRGQAPVCPSQTPPHSPHSSPSCEISMRAKAKDCSSLHLYHLSTTCGQGRDRGLQRGWGRCAGCDLTECLVQVARAPPLTARLERPASSRSHAFCTWRRRPWAPRPRLALLGVCAQCDHSTHSDTVPMSLGLDLQDHASHPCCMGLTFLCALGGEAWPGACGQPAGRVDPRAG